MSGFDEEMGKSIGKVVVTLGDITEQEVDAIVNAANKSLMGGAGVDGAIHEKGGTSIVEECRRIRDEQYPDGLPTGEAVMTTAGELPAKFVIHTVGPIFGQHDGEEERLLAMCYRNSLLLAAKHELKSVAFPAISTGAYGYPKAEAAKIASTTVREFIHGGSSIEEVRLVFFGQEDMLAFLNSHAL
jgi:O-acetyl-ADP-ribose deacetylase (regulator of RNase III)